MSVFDVVDRIYKMNPCAAVRYRLKRIMGEEIEPELFDEFYNSKWVEILKANQNSDGGFGRFHSRDSKIKQVFPTTELAVDSIKMLDIPRGNELVDKLCDYMEKLLRNEIACLNIIRGPFEHGIREFGKLKRQAFIPGHIFGKIIIKPYLRLV
ncbi:MAG: hypothetical protein GX059_03780, partial [Clostridiales bacterium]|nr:hypothetical protein [Clostridiales bacterium]